MAGDRGFAWAEAFLTEQRFLGFWSPRQQITLQLSGDGDDDCDVAVCLLGSGEARELAFRLLVLAEHAGARAGDGVA